jgi:hypothetical protein
MDYQVVCAVPDGNDPDRRIDAIGAAGLGIVPEDRAIAMIDVGHRFHTYVSGFRAEVYVKGGGFTRRFLTTSPDGYGPNNLCKLPRCA